MEKLELRTKSTIIFSSFRILETKNDKILIDNIDINLLGLDKLIKNE